MLQLIAMDKSPYHKIHEPALSEQRIRRLQPTKRSDLISCYTVRQLSFSPVAEKVRREKKKAQNRTILIG